MININMLIPILIGLSMIGIFFGAKTLFHFYKLYFRFVEFNTRVIHLDDNIANPQFGKYVHVCFPNILKICSGDIDIHGNHSISKIIENLIILGFSEVGRDFLVEFSNAIYLKYYKFMYDSNNKYYFCRQDILNFCNVVDQIPIESKIKISVAIM